MSTGSIMMTAYEARPLRESRAYRSFFAAAIAASVSGASTGFRLVAEGVETEEEARTPTVLGVALGQGYLSGRPEPAPKAWAGAQASDGRAGRGKGAGRAGFQAARTGAAMIGQRLVGRKFQIGDDLAEEEERPDPRVQHHRVLADPADARRRGEFPFDDRRRVHAHAGLERLGERAPKARQEGVELLAQHYVVVLASSVPGDAAARRQLRMEN